jgi:CRISPR-associated protein Cas2
MEEWHGQHQQGSITMVWRETGAPGRLQVQSLGEPANDLTEHEGSLLVRRPLRKR